MNFRKYPLPTPKDPWRDIVTPAVAADVRNPKLVPGAYISRDKRLYLVIGPERDGDGAVTGKVELENALTLHRSADTLDMVTRWYNLVKPAPAVVVPAHLDAELTEHVKAAGLRV